MHAKFVNALEAATQFIYKHTHPRTIVRIKYTLCLLAVLFVSENGISYYIRQHYDDWMEQSEYMNTFIFII